MKNIKEYISVKFYNYIQFRYNFIYRTYHYIYNSIYILAFFKLENYFLGLSFNNINKNILIYIFRNQKILLIIKNLLKNIIIFVCLIY